VGSGGGYYWYCLDSWEHGSDHAGRGGSAEEISRKGKKSHGSGVLASGLIGRERENRVSEDAILTTCLARLLEGWIET
jgi:hypothetical protein